MAYLHKSIIYLIRIEVSKGFLQTISGWLSGKDLPAMQETQETWVQIPSSGRSPGEGQCNPLQYSCMENPMDRGAWRGTVRGVTKSWTRLHGLLQWNKKTTYRCLTKNNKLKKISSKIISRSKRITKEILTTKLMKKRTLEMSYLRGKCIYKGFYY